MGQVLSAPVASKNLERRGNRFLRVGSCEMQGYRVNMEDTHTIQLSMGDKHPDKSFFAVFDGHGGDKASLFMADKLWQAVSRLDDPTSKEELIKCVQSLDTEFLKSKEEDRENGSTAVFAVVDPVKSDGGDFKKWAVTIGNLGDSRAIVVRSDGKLEALTKDHKPESKDEESRIQAAGGFVRQNRVDGQLAMSRAIGDSKYKDQQTLAPGKQKVIAIPDISSCVVERGDRLLLYCDGIVEQMQNEDVSSFVHKELKEVKSQDQDPAQVLVRLIDWSLQKGSKDNMSALLIIFDDGTDYNQSKSEFIAGPFHPHKSDEAFRNAYLADAKRHGYQGEELMTMAKKAEELAAKSPAPPIDNQPNMMLKSLIQSLASNLGGLPGENREEKALALMHFLQGGQFGDSDTSLTGSTSASTRFEEEEDVSLSETSIEQFGTSTMDHSPDDRSTGSGSGETVSPSSPTSPTTTKKKKKKKKKKNTGGSTTSS